MPLTPRQRKVQHLKESARKIAGPNTKEQIASLLFQAGAAYLFDESSSFAEFDRKLDGLAATLREEANEHYGQS